MGDPAPIVAPTGSTVTVEPKRNADDVWDDRLKMGGAIAIALAIIGVLAWLAIRGDTNTAVVGLFGLALDRVIRYFFNTGTA